MIEILILLNWGESCLTKPGGFKGVKHFGQREFNSMFCEHIECFIVRPGDTFQLFKKINVIMMLRGEGLGP